MDVQMGDLLHAISAMIGKQPVSGLSQLQLPGHLADSAEKSTDFLD